MRDELETYLAQRSAEGWSRTTLKGYRVRLEHLASFLERRDIVRAADVRDDLLDKYLTSLKRAGWKRGSRQTYMYSARGFFRWLAENGKILTNPARGLEVEALDERELPVPPLSQDQAAAILDNLPRRNVIDLRNRAFVELLYGCGLRVAEALALDLKDVDFTGNTVLVRHGKGGKQRRLPLGRGAKGAVKDYLALRRSLLKGPDTGALFMGNRGKRWVDDGVRTAFERINRQRPPGIPKVHPHLFRHSSAVHLLQNGADIRYVQEFLGHADLDTTKIYLRMVPGHLKKDYEAAMPDIPVGVSA